jgi:hypothetical protein
MTDDLVKRLREGRTKGSNLEWRVTAVHLEAAARIEELEAYVAQIEKAAQDAVEALRSTGSAWPMAAGKALKAALNPGKDTP